MTYNINLKYRVPTLSKGSEVLAVRRMLSAGWVYEENKEFWLRWKQKMTESSYTLYLTKKTNRDIYVVMKKIDWPLNDEYWFVPFNSTGSIYYGYLILKMDTGVAILDTPTYDLIYNEEHQQHGYEVSDMWMPGGNF